MLEIKELKKYFGGVKAVDGCNFKVEEQLITALIGPNGAGKSTIFNLISGILREDSGKIIFKGDNITKFSPAKVSNTGISRLFQQSRLFSNLTVKENLLLSLDNEDMKFWKSLFHFGKNDDVKDKKSNQILKLIAMEKFKDTIARDLSYGQKRLIELARSILNPHSFLMLDEPVAGINPQLRKIIAQTILSLKKRGETVLLIEHDMSFTLNIADRVIVMDEGRVIAEGNPTEIKKNPKVLKAYLGS